MDNPLNQPLFTSVPMGSVVVFAALWPASLALCVQLFVGRQVDQGKTVRGPQLVGRTVAIGVLASLGTGILPLPATLLGAATNGRLIGIAYAAELLVIVVVAVPIMARQWRQQRLNPAAEGRYRNPLMVRYAAVYLAVMGCCG